MGAFAQDGPAFGAEQPGPAGRVPGFVRKVGVARKRVIGKRVVRKRGGQALMSGLDANRLDLTRLVATPSLAIRAH
jgi:hypothetical protein